LIKISDTCIKFGFCKTKLSGKLAEDGIARYVLAIGCQMAWGARLRRIALDAVTQLGAIERGTNVG
jgi:hypothetical protein